MATLAIASCWLPNVHWSALPAAGLFLLYRIVPAVSVTLAFALAAWGMRAVTLSGAVAGFLVTLLISLVAGLSGFLLVFTVFVLTFLATRIGYSRKQRIGAAESHHGRNASQVYANLGVAAMCAAPMLVFPNIRGLLLGVTAALAEAAADTVSSEVGQAFNERPVLITTFHPVKPGTDGGISLVGTIAGIVAACIVTAISVWGGLMYADFAAIVILSATIGMFFDSLLGATMESPDGLGNDAVNFLSSTMAAFFALLTYLIHQIRS